MGESDLISQWDVALRSMAMGAAVLSGLHLVWLTFRGGLRVRCHPRPRPSRVAIRLLGLTGTSLALAPQAEAGPPNQTNRIPALERFAASGPSLPGPAEAPPWLGSDGSPPPRPSEPAEAGPNPPPKHAAHEQSRDGERTHTVKSGDTLWDIASAALRSDDPRRIARYWPRIHRANRETIGADPNLIRPGQILRLPPEVGT